MWPIRDAILWHDRKAVQPRIHTKTAHRNRTTQCPQPLNTLSKTTLQFTWSITMFSFDWGLHSALNLKLVRFAFARVKNQKSIQYMKSRGASTLLITWVAQPEKGSLCPCDFDVEVQTRENVSSILWDRKFKDSIIIIYRFTWYFLWISEYKYDISTKPDIPSLLFMADARTESATEIETITSKLPVSRRLLYQQHAHDTM